MLATTVVATIASRNFTAFIGLVYFSALSLKAEPNIIGQPCHRPTLYDPRLSNAIINQPDFVSLSINNSLLAT